MTMIKERYCSSEIAKLLKEKGFNVGSSKYITPQMAMDWLREKGILLWVYPAICLKVDDNRTFHWMWDGKKQRHDAQHFGDKRSYDSYEKAEEAAIKYSLENLI